MTEAFLAALVDALVPGGALGNAVTAPSGSACGLHQVLRPEMENHMAARAVACDEDGFLAAGTEMRTAILQRVQAEHPEAFAGLVAFVLSAYYETPSVIEAFGWTARPPQPKGHALPPFDESLLEPVRRRGPIRRRPSPLEDLIAAHLGATFPALALMVMQGAEVRVHRAWGHVDPDTRRKRAETSTLFDLASLSKLFTATAFLSLASEGRVAIDDPLVRVVPEFGGSERAMDGGVDPHSKQDLPVFATSQGRTADPQRATFRQLLTHTCGLAPWRPVYAEAGPAPAPPDEAEPVPRNERWARALAALIRYPFVAQPGERILYSDIGFMLLGEAIARLHGAPLEQAIKARVIDPMGLSSLAYNPVRSGTPFHRIVPTEFDADWRQRRCWGEVHDENACGVGGVAGHAGLFGTVDDVARFGYAWLAGDPSLRLSPDLRHCAVSEQVSDREGLRRGLGFLLYSDNSSAGDVFSRDSFGHTGFTGTSLWIDPQRELVVACLTNRVYLGRNPQGIHAFRRALHDLMAGAEATS